jgi:quinol monooxygenase YgiN
MIRKVAQYKVKKVEVRAVEQAIIEFVAAITQNEPHTFYEAYQGGDGVSFIHFMAFPDQDAENQHMAATYTMKFAEVLFPRWEAAPTFTDLKLVRSSTTSAETD